MKSAKSDEKVGESYIPNDKLVQYMELRLQREKNKRDPESIPEDLSDKNRRKIKNLDRMKVHILNKHIFQAMANLTFFFEYIAENSEFQEVFEDNLKELLFGSKKSDNTRSVNKSLFVNKSQPIFARLIEAALAWNERKDPNNFRLALIYILQNIIFQKINNFALTEFGDAFANNVVQIDMGR